MSRDPIGYEGGVNLYRYVRNAPLGRTDPTGLLDLTVPIFISQCSLIGPIRSDKQCCDAVRNNKDKLGIHATVLGVVVCCDGKKRACALTSSHSGATDPTATAISESCIRVHEKSHFPGTMTCRHIPHGIWIPSFKPVPGQVPGAVKVREECLAHARQVQCLLEGKEKCANNAACLGQVEKEIEEVAKLHKAYCSQLQLLPK